MSAQDALVTPEVMTWARESAGLSIDAAARKLGVRPRRVIEWEEGVDYPSLPQARAAAHVYRRPLAVLFLEAPPAEPAAPPDFRSLPDVGPRETTPELRYQLRLAAFRRATALELDPNPEQPITTLVGTSPTDTDPEAAASDLRRHLQITWAEQLGWRDNYAALNAWRAAVESLGVLVFRFGEVPTTVARGFSLGGAVYPVVGLNASDAPAGRVFTLMHELGHLIAGTGGLCDLEDRAEARSPEARAAERFCNRLAAAVLMPSQELYEFPAVARADAATLWTLPELQETANAIKVSRHSLLIRLLELGKTNEAAFQQTLTALNRAGPGQRGTGFELVPEGVIREVGLRYARLVLAAYQNESITARDLAEYLGVRFKHVQRIQELAQAERS